MIRKIIQIGNPILNMVSKPLGFPLSKEDKTLISDLLDTAKSVGDKGAGLSAAQIGISKRVAICRRVDIEELIIRLNEKLYIGKDFSKNVVEIVEKLIEKDSLLLIKNTEEIAEILGLTKVSTKLTKNELKETFEKIDDKLWLPIINPEILHENDYETIYWEGCLSIGIGKNALYAPVPRTEVIEFKYYNVTGKQHKMKTADYFAHVVLHEIDHMEGILFITRVEKIENIWKSGELDEYIKKHKKYPLIK